MLRMTNDHIFVYHVKSHSCFILLIFPKLSFGSAGTPTYAPYLEYAVEDHNQVSQTIFRIS